MLTAKHISSHPLFKPESSYLCYSIHTTAPLKGWRGAWPLGTSGAGACWCSGSGWGSSTCSLTVPLELCGPCDKVAWWVGNLCLPAPGPARGAGKLPCWKDRSIQTQTYTHVQLLSGEGEPQKQEGCVNSFPLEVYGCYFNPVNYCLCHLWH